MLLRIAAIGADIMGALDRLPFCSFSLLFLYVVVFWGLAIYGAIRLIGG